MRVLCAILGLVGSVGAFAGGGTQAAGGANAGPEPSVFKAAAMVDGSACATLEQAPFDLPQLCCHACHHPFLMQYNDLSLEVITTDRAVAITKTHSVAAVVPSPPGSGDSPAPAESATTVEIASEAYKAERADAIFRSASTVVVPCGECISLDECAHRGRHVELWHHRCVV